MANGNLPPERTDLYSLAGGGAAPTPPPPQPSPREAGPPPEEEAAPAGDITQVTRSTIQGLITLAQFYSRVDPEITKLIQDFLTKVEKRMRKLAGGSRRLGRSRGRAVAPPLGMGTPFGRE